MIIDSPYLTKQKNSTNCAFFIVSSNQILKIQTYENDIRVILYQWATLCYSRLRNKHRGTLINFWIFFPEATSFFKRVIHKKKSKILSFDEVGYDFSRGYVYCFSQMFQALRLFKGLRLFQSLEYLGLDAQPEIQILKQLPAALIKQTLMVRAYLI